AEGKSNAALRTTNGQVYNLVVENCHTALRLSSTNHYGVQFTGGVLHANGGTPSIAVHVPIQAVGDVLTAVALFHDVDIGADLGYDVLVDPPQPNDPDTIHLAFQDCSFDTATLPATNSIEVWQGSLTVENCLFRPLAAGQKHVWLSNATLGAIICGNRFSTG